MNISPGETVGPYRIIEQLGSGGMATVFKAYHPALDRYVAIKILHPVFKADPQFFERFKREARIVANLEHANIIPVYDFNEHQGEPYLVMRYVEGDTLKAHMQGRPMAPPQILGLMRPVCQALAYAHRQGVLHRDIKPSNVMISKDGSVFLSDFGLARMVQVGESTLSQDMMVGTPQYISPEQAQGISNLDGRTDIYSLGVVLFEMLTGRVPFNADTPFATVHDHIYSPLPLPSAINPNINPAAERLLLKALAKEPDDRFATADELLEALEKTLGAQIVAATPPQATATPQQAATPWWVWAGSAVLVICLLGVLLTGLLLLRNRSQQPPQANTQPTAGPVVDQNQAGNGSQQTASPSTGQPTAGNHNEAIILTQQASQALRENKLEEAARLYEQAIAADPTYLPPYFGLSEALRRTNNVPGAIAALEDATEVNPDKTDAWLRLGEAQLFAAENPEAALEAFTQAAALEPETSEPYAGQALALLKMEQPEAAKEAIDTALLHNPVNPVAKLANAVYLAQQGNRLRAIREFQQIIQDDATPPLIKERARDLLARLRQ